MSWSQRLTSQLQQQQQQQLWRQRLAVNPLTGAEITVKGRHYINFSSNDYLGLSQHPDIIDAWCEGARRWGTGAGASGYVTGYSPIQQQLEQRLAEWLGYSRSIVFGSGFSANQALIFALVQAGDYIITDKLMHASLQEAAWLSPATFKRFPHNSLTGLEHLLNSAQHQLSLVVTEGVFSMDGDFGRLSEIAQRCQEHACYWMVDDAHGIGVVGPEGKGSCALFQVRPNILLITFGKAFGIGGAAILCDDLVANYLEQHARHLIYSTGIPAAQVFAIDRALTIIQQQSELRDQLQSNIQLFREQAKALSWQLLPSNTAIQPLIIGDNHRALEIAEQLRRRNCWVTAIRPPTVPVGSARLRLTLSAQHQPSQIHQLIEALNEIAN